MNENNPVAFDRKYRAQAVKIIDERCTGCAASRFGVIDKKLCNALPPCTKSRRTDGRNVIFVDCGPAPNAGGEP